MLDFAGSISWADEIEAGAYEIKAAPGLAAIASSVARAAVNNRALPG